METVSGIVVQEERRKTPRIAFHHPISIMGVDEEAQIRNFSLGGFFIQMDPVKPFNDGQLINLASRFPDEKKGTLIRVRLVHIQRNGFGCQFVDLNERISEMLKETFEIFSSTIPID